MIKKKHTLLKCIIVFFIIAITLFRSIYVFALTLPENKGEINVFIDGVLTAKPVKIKFKLYRIKEIYDPKEEKDSEKNEIDSDEKDDELDKIEKNETDDNTILKEETKEEKIVKDKKDVEDVEDAEISTDSNGLNFRFTKEFKKIADIDKRLKEDSEEYVTEIKEFAIENNIKCIEQEVDYLTHAHFENLELGKYLVVIDDFVMDNKLFECNSFIITIPMMQNDKYEFIINANPKVSEIIINPPPEDQNNVNNTVTNENETNTDTNTNVITNSAGENKVDDAQENKEQERKRLPDTGLPIVSVIVLSVLGLICIIVGCILDKRTRKK